QDGRSGGTSISLIGGGTRHAACVLRSRRALPDHTRQLVMHHVDRRAHVFAPSGGLEVCVARRDRDLGDVFESGGRGRHVRRHRIAEKALERGQLLESVPLDLFSIRFLSDSLIRFFTSDSAFEKSFLYEESRFFHFAGISTTAG